MFGTDDDNQTTPTNSAPPIDSGVATDASLPSAPGPEEVVNPISGSQALPGAQTSSTTPVVDPDPGPAPTIKTDKRLMAAQHKPAQSSTVSSIMPVPVAADYIPAAPPAPATPTVADDKSLTDVKHKAIQDLTPLVSKLDLNPEEKFKTLMMLIQTSDNPDLLSEAHEAANQIEDTNTRAQALLDVVNEVNYFTKSKSQDSGELKV